jgi:hypothetical protein
MERAIAWYAEHDDQSIDGIAEQCDGWREAK